MKKIPSLNDFCCEDKHGRTAADKFLRSKGVKRGSRFAVGDGYLNCRNFFLAKDGHLLEVITLDSHTVDGALVKNQGVAELDEEAYEYIYKALVLGRGHLWKDKVNDLTFLES